MTRKRDCLKSRGIVKIGMAQKYLVSGNGSHHVIPAGFWRESSHTERSAPTKSTNNILHKMLKYFIVPPIFLFDVGCRRSPNLARPRPVQAHPALLGSGPVIFLSFRSPRPRPDPPAGLFPDRSIIAGTRTFMTHGMLPITFPSLFSVSCFSDMPK